MNKLIFNLYRILVPKPIRTSILKKNLRRKIPEYFSALPENEVNDEQREVLKYLENNPVTTFPYPFRHKYSPEKIEVYFDQLSGMRYVVQDGKKLFFKKRWSKKRIMRAYADLSREQDSESPHRYLSENFGTCSDDDKHIRLDTLISTRPEINFLKIDVDGNERKVLEGAGDVLTGISGLKIALRTYHNNNDETDFTSLLERHGFRVSPSKGYMIHYYDKKIKAPWLRRGVIRASR